MIKNILNLTLLTLLNFLLLKRSGSIDVDQLFYDIEALGLSTYINRANVNFSLVLDVFLLIGEVQKVKKHENPLALYVKTASITEGSLQNVNFSLALAAFLLIREVQKQKMMKIHWFHV